MTTLPIDLEPQTLGDLVRDLGDIPINRIVLKPPAGTATESDLVRLIDHEDRIVELVDATLVEKAMGLKESIVAVTISGILGTFVRRHKLGVVAGADGPIRLALKLVRIPDVSVILWSQLPSRKLPQEPIPNLHPDLAVEVLSESNTRAEMRRKLQEYFAAGCQIVWLVDETARSVCVFTSLDEWKVFNEENELDGGTVLPGFRVCVAELFEDIPQ